MSKLKTMDEIRQQNQELAELRARARDLAQRSKEFAKQEREQRIARKVEACEFDDLKPYVEALYAYATRPDIKAYCEYSDRQDGEEILDQLVERLNASLGAFGMRDWWRA